MFDKDKSYSIAVWDMTFYVIDAETGERINNEDGTPKLFHVDNYEYSYLADGLDVNDLTLVDTHREYR